MEKTKESVNTQEGLTKQVKSELKKVKWPTKKELIKHVIATLGFIIFFALFFYGIETLFAFIKGLMS